MKGEKRIMSDNMILNDDCPLLDGVTNKVKCDTLSNPDNGFITIEAEVGDGQPCPAL